MSKSIIDRAASGERLVIAGPVGTELHNYGIETPPPLYSANGLQTLPGRVAVEEVQQAYVAAGCDLLPTASFGTRSIHALEKHGIDPKRARELTAHAVTIAMSVAARSGRRPMVVGDDGSIENCYDPKGELSLGRLVEYQRLHAENLKGAGAKFAWYETIPSGDEAEAALIAAREEGLAVAGLCFYVRPDARSGIELPTGETLPEVVGRIEKYDIGMIGVNCVTGDAALTAAEVLRAYDWPIAIYANGLETEPNDDPDARALHDQANNDYIIGVASDLFAIGASVVGGCCVTTPKHTQAFRLLADQANRMA